MESTANGTAKAEPLRLAAVPAEIDRDELSALLEDISHGQLPAMSEERRQLAVLAAESAERRRSEDVARWARELALSATQIDD